MENITRLLPGKWNIYATNFPMWLSEKRNNPSISYELLKEKPLTFSDIVVYQNQKGKKKTIIGEDRMHKDELEWRGKGVLKLLRSRWKVVYLDETILVIQFERSLLTPQGMDILIRDGVDNFELSENVTELIEKNDLQLLVN